MASQPDPDPLNRLKSWLLQGQNQADAEVEGPYEDEHAVKSQHHTHSWWQVMCLTGVDYFSTLGYQPGIAALAAGALSPIATLVLVLVTLFGALPVYNRIAAESPHGNGSISMLERLLSYWPSKLFVLVLLGFVATDFIITITLSAADASAHIIENPFVKNFVAGQQVPITLVLVGLLGLVFLRGFGEAIGIAVVLVVAYLGLNLVVGVRGIIEVIAHPSVFANWTQALTTRSSNPFLLIGLALLIFPKLALGLSGFETGVAVMPLVKGDPDEAEENPVGRIRNTRRLLATAAIIMSVFLIVTSLITTLLIPHAAFEKGGEANGRALAYLAHTFFGDVFGTVYDISTILILWFAGASAMAGLLNIVPRYLPRYGMAPDWTRANRPLVLIYIAVAFAVTVIFKADVDAQGGAYATGVLVLITSAAVAVTLSARQKGQRLATVMFGVISLVFVYTLVDNALERPDGVRIAGFFIASIVIISLVSRTARSTELRVERIELDENAERFLARAVNGPMRLIANQLDEGDLNEYDLKGLEVRYATHLPSGDPTFFLEVRVADASEFADVLEVKGIDIGGSQIFRVEGSSVPNAIAAFLLYVRDHTQALPHVYFEWSETGPLHNAARFLFSGEGDIAPLTHEILRQAEPNAKRRPLVHVGG